MSGHVSAAVIRVTSITCDAGSEGSGFLIDSATVVTAAHVVDEAAVEEVQSKQRTQAASVERIDNTADLAVLELDQPLTTASLDFAGNDAGTGDDVAMVGYPDGSELQSLFEGSVDTTDVTTPVADITRPHLVATTAKASPGNSGGPLVDADGGADDLPSEPDLTSEVVDTLAGYFSGINTGDYSRSYEQLSPTQQNQAPYDEFVEQVRTGYDHQLDIQDADIDPEHATVWLEFTSLQAPELSADGQSCSRWSLDYDLARTAAGSYHIDRVLEHGNSDNPERCG